MRDDLRCPRCQSTRVIPGVGTNVAVSVGKQENTVAVAGVRPCPGNLCADCGHLDLVMPRRDREKLWDRYLKVRAGKLRAGRLRAGTERVQDTVIRDQI